MLKLDSSVYLDGIQGDVALVLSACQNVTTLTPPVLIADIRNQVEAGQLQPFTDEAFNQYLLRISNLALDNSVLTNAEISVFNTIREYLNPAPSLSCCGGTALPLDSEVEFIANPRAGTGASGDQTYQYEWRVALDGEFTCDIAKVNAFLTLTEATIDQEDVVLLPLGCVGGKMTFAFLWSSYDDDPVTGELTADLDLLDANDNVLGGTITKVITL